MPLTQFVFDDFNRRFNSHKPPNEDAGRMHGDVRKQFFETAVILAELMPSCREASLVLTKLEEAMFWANAALARHWSFWDPVACRWDFSTEAEHKADGGAFEE